MKKLSGLALLLQLLVPTISFGEIAEEVVYISTPLDAIAAKATSRLLKRPEVIDSTPVFDPNEVEYLNDIGEGFLSKSYRLFFKDEDAFKELEKWVESQGLKINFDRGEEPEVNQVSTDTEEVSREQLFRYQWALYNNVGPVIADAVDGLGNPVGLRGGVVTPLDSFKRVRIPGLPRAVIQTENGTSSRGEDINFVNAPPENMDAPKVIVAVLDTGVDSSHPDLKNKVVYKKEECDALEAFGKCLEEAGDDRAAVKACSDQWETFDSDQNGYAMDCSGWNVTAIPNRTTGVKGDPDSSDAQGHGTHIAGIIAAEKDGLGIQGVLQNVEILPVKVSLVQAKEPAKPQSLFEDPEPLPGPKDRDNRYSRSLPDTVARGVLYALRSGAHIISMSLAWTPRVKSMIMERFIDIAKSRGVAVVSSAANDSTDARVFPCRYSWVVCVGAHGPDGAMSHYSNYGGAVDIAGPGTRILSTYPYAVYDKKGRNFTEVRGYVYKNGTSFATPYVAGVLARIMTGYYEAPATPLAIPEVDPTSGLRDPPPSPFDVQGAIARLLLGSRPTQSDATGLRPAYEKYVRFGNADLAGAMAVREERSLIVPAEKGPINLSWALLPVNLPVKIPLVNRWKAAAGPVKVKVTARESGRPEREVSILNNEVEFPTWDEGEEKILDLRLVIADTNMDGSVEINVQVEDGGAVFNYRMLAEISIDVNASLADLDTVEKIPLQVEQAIDPRRVSVRTVTSYDGSYSQDYIFLGRKRSNWTIQLIKESGETGSRIYQPTEIVEIEDLPRSALFVINRIDMNLDGKSEYLFIFQKQVDRDENYFHFRLYDEDLNPMVLPWSGNTEPFYEYDNKAAVITDRVQFMAMKQADGSYFRVPLWLYWGQAPPLEHKAPTFWDQDPANPLLPRAYYFAPDGVRTVQSPGFETDSDDDDWMIVEFLQPTAVEKTNGEVPVLLAHGLGDFLEYSVGIIKDSVVLPNDRKFDLPKYRGLIGKESILPIFSLSAGPDTLGTAISHAGRLGSQRTTGILRDSDSIEVFDSTMATTGLLDNARLVSGVFSGQSRNGVFVLNNYDVQYHDADTGESAIGSQRKFLYVPSLIQSRSFFPVVVSDSRSESFLPGLLAIPGRGDTTATEIIIPYYDDEGKLQSLMRPARLRVRTGQCTVIENPTRIGSNSAQSMAAFCGDHFLRIPLSY